MRVVIVTESFPPRSTASPTACCGPPSTCSAGGTSRSSSPRRPRAARRAPRTPSAPAGVPDELPVVRVPSVPLPGYPQVRIALPSRQLAAAVQGHRPDLVHLASPFVLGARGAQVAARLGLPIVAVYQTDLAGYAHAYRAGRGLGEAAAWHRIRTVHGLAARTLAPSTPAAQDLTAHGVSRVHLWPRGVDSARFHPRHRDESLHRALAPGGEVLVGYVGRLAPEKRVDLLAETATLPGVRVVIIGDGPSAPGLKAAMPGAVFLGRRTGEELARCFATLDVFVHTGPLETFCQTIQEAMASGVPVIGPAAAWTARPGGAPPHRPARPAPRRRGGGPGGDGPGRGRGNAGGVRARRAGGGDGAHLGGGRGPVAAALRRGAGGAPRRDGRGCRAL